MTKNKAESVTLTRDGKTRTFDSPSDAVKARHDGWVPVGTKPSEPADSAKPSETKK